LFAPHKKIGGQLLVQQLNVIKDGVLFGRKVLVMVVKLLLEQGNVDVNSKDSSGRTPLSFAAEWGNETVVKLLLEQGNVDVNSEDSSGRTPLSIAADHPESRLNQVFPKRQ